MRDIYSVDFVVLLCSPFLRRLLKEEIDASDAAEEIEGAEEEEEYAVEYV